MSIKLFLSRTLFLVLFLFSSFVNAQLNQPDRFEIPLENLEYEVISADSKGLFLITKNSRLRTNENGWRVIMLDTLFNLVWAREYVVPSKQTLLGKYFEGDKLHFLFAKNDPKDRNLELISFEQETGAAESRIIRNYIPLALYDFKVIDNAIVVVGYYNYRPLVLHFDFDSQVPSILPGLFMEDASITQLKVNPNKTFNILVKGRDFDREVTIFLFTYSFRGELISKVALDTEQKKSLLFAQTVPLSSQAQMIAGVYGNRNSEYSKGIFLANVNEYGEQQIQYINYADLSNFFNYLKDRKEQRIRRRIARRRAKDKKIKFTYRLLVHDIIEDNGNYIVLGEAFYPKYKQVQGDYYGIFAPVWTVNRGLFKTNYIFDGYQYTHAVVLGFNQKGKLLWDNSFEINDVRTFELEQFVHATKVDDNLALLYVFNDKIRTKVIKENTVVEDKDFVPIQLKYDNDQLQEGTTEIFGLKSWYGNALFTYGKQTIKNLQTAGVELKREVFFINKVLYK